MGKYSALKGKLPAFSQEKSWQEKIDAEKASILGAAENAEDVNIGWLGAKYVEARKAKADHEEQIKALNTTIEALTQLLVSTLEGNGEEQVRLNSGVSLSLKFEPYPYIVDSHLTNQWYRDTGQEFRLTINAQRLKTDVKALLEAGKEAMPGVEIYLKSGLNVRGLKGLGDD